MKTLATNRKLHNPIYWLIVAILFNFALVIYLFVSVLQSNNKDLERRQQDFESESVKNQIIHYDEILTMSARMASLTGDPIWEERYNKHTTLLDKSLLKARQLSSTLYRDKLAKILVAVNERLITIETEAFAKVNANQLEEAQTLLFSDTYKAEKVLYNKIVTHLVIYRDRILRLKQLLDQVRYVDEVLTMSARMAALTGVSEWRERYTLQASILEAAITEVQILSSNPESRRILGVTDHANEQLISMEAAAFAFVDQNQPKKAAEILLGKDYQFQKSIYTAGIKDFSETLQSEIDKIRLSEKREEYLNIFIILLLTTLLFIVTAVLVRRVHLWEAHLEKSNEALEKKTNELQVFSYSISHDLKAPLKTIQGFSDRINKSIVKNEFERITIFNQHIFNNARRLDLLIDDVLSIIKSDHVSETPERLDLEAILVSIEESLAHVNTERQVVIKKNLLHQQSLIAPKNAITQILENLISNSMKYANSEQDNSYVSIQSDNLPNDLFVIRVQDNGLGIPKNQQHKIFDMFFRAYPEISFGSGLGLYLIKKKVAHLSGTIEFVPLAGGTEFVIIIPRDANIGDKH